MGTRIGRQDDRPLCIGFTNCRVAGLLEIEVGQSVVDQIDLDVSMLEPATSPLERGRVGDSRSKAVALEQTLEKEELRIQVLLLGRSVYDCNRRECARVTPELPFASNMSMIDRSNFSMPAVVGPRSC